MHVAGGVQPRMVAEHERPRCVEQPERCFRHGLERVCWVEPLASPDRSRQAGPFVVSAPVRNEVTLESVTEVLNELRRIRTGDIEARELEDTKNYLAGVFPSTVQSASDIAGRLLDMELYDLPHNYFDHYREKKRTDRFHAPRVVKAGTQPRRVKDSSQPAASRQTPCASRRWLRRFCSAR